MKCDPSRGPSGYCYTHDSENRLTSFTDGDGVQGFYTYDAMGRRVSKTFNGTYADVSFAHAGDMEIAEYDSQGRLLRRFVPGPRTDIRAAMIEYDPVTGVETARYGYLTNRLGSVVAVVDAAGTVTDKYIYTPFGVEAPLDASGNPFRYTGRKLDPETGLYYYRARYYDPGHGRFLETDPVFYEDQMNLYAYVGNDPVNMVDPSGLCGTAANEYQDCEINVDVDRTGLSDEQNEALDERIDQTRSDILTVGKAIAQSGSDSDVEAWEKISNFDLKPQETNDDADASADPRTGVVTMFAGGVTTNAGENRYVVFHESTHYRSDFAAQLRAAGNDPSARRAMEINVDRYAHARGSRLTADGKRLYRIYEVQPRYFRY